MKVKVIGLVLLACFIAENVATTEKGELKKAFL